ncbi:tail fiber protein [Rhizobium phage RHEph21]|uniref:Tail fiber protein n=2 Tax=root TaxID=1 RepID=A0AAE7VMU2_9CAUD|nr:tail fiber protein [Rhizobium phage RHEph21]
MAGSRENAGAFFISKKETLMALAYFQSVGDGTTRNYNVTFPFISKDHIAVKVNGVPVTYTWLTGTTVQLTAAPAAGAVVDVRRVTPRDTLLVDFVDGSTLVETDLDLSALQVFYLAQEAFDLGEASLGVTDDGSFSALNRRISNVLDPTLAQDVATKHFVETGVTSQVVIATGKANEANYSKLAAAASETAAAGYATSANNSKNAAASSASAALTSEQTAASHQTQTGLDKAATAADRVQTGLDRAAASASASAAATSAQQAALFDPSSYYTKTQADAKYLTSVTAANDFYTKTQADGKFLTSTSAAADFYTKTQIDTSLGNKFDKSGGTITGDLAVQKANPAVRLTGAARSYYWQTYDADNSIRLVDATAGVEMLKLTPGQQYGVLSTYVTNVANDRALAYANDRVANLQYRHVSYNVVATAANSVRNAPGGSLMLGVKITGSGRTSYVDQITYVYPQVYDPVRGWIGFSQAY